MDVTRLTTYTIGSSKRPFALFITVGLDVAWVMWVSMVMVLKRAPIFEWHVWSGCYSPPTLTGAGYQRMIPTSKGHF